MIELELFYLLKTKQPFPIHLVPCQSLDPKTQLPLDFLVMEDLSKLKVNLRLCIQVSMLTWQSNPDLC